MQNFRQNVLSLSDTTFESLASCMGTCYLNRFINNNEMGAQMDADSFKQLSISIITLAHYVMPREFFVKLQAPRP